MTRALYLCCMALGPYVVPALEIGTDDLIAARDNSPARLRLPGGGRQGCAEHRGCRQHLRACSEFRAFARQVGCEQFRKLLRGQIGEGVRSHLDHARRLAEDARCLLAKRRLVLANIGRVRSVVNESDSVRMDARFRDDRTTITVAT